MQGAIGMKKSHKLYVVTRRDLPKSYQAVQAGHALAEYLLQTPSTEWNNGTLVYLGVNDEEELAYQRDRLALRSITHVEFREPDIGDELTAIAAVCDGKALANLKLL